MSVHDRSGRAREDLVVARLRELAPALDGEPDPDFRAATRARLVAMAAVRSPAPVPVSGLQRLLGVRTPDAAPARWRTRLTAGLAGAALTVTAAAALVAVADGARPGDVLYDLKRGTEQTQLALAGDARGRTLLDFASTRLDELAALVGDGGTALPAEPADGPDGAPVSAAGADPALVLETLRTMDEQTVDGTVWLTDRAVTTGDAAPLDHLDRWAAGQAGELATLEHLVPDAATEAVAGSLELLAEVGARTDALQAALGCPTGPSVDGADELGPLPSPGAGPEPAPPGAEGGGGSVATSAPGSGAPAPSDPALPTVPPPAGTGSGDTGTGTPPTPRAPTPRVPAPPPGGGLIPSLPLPVPGGGTGGGPGGGAGGGTGGPTSVAPPPVVPLPVPGPVSVCLPPLLTDGC